MAGNIARHREQASRLLWPLLITLSILPALSASAAAPRITGSPPTTATVGSNYRFTPQASDADGDRLRFSISNRPAWAAFDSRTGRLSGTPARQHIGTTSNITIGVTDGRTRVTLPRFSITVRASGTQTPTNSPPVISGTPPTQILQDQAYSFTPTATDPNGDPLTFSIVNRPAWASFSTSTGRLSGTPRAGDIGNYSSITIRVSDGRSTTSLAPFSIAVVGTAGGSATLSWQAPTTRTNGSPLNNLAGYRVLWGTTRGSYSGSVRLTNPGITTYVVNNLTPATYYFVVTAIDTNGAESGYSNEAQKTVR